MPGLVGDTAPRLRRDPATGLYEFGFALAIFDGPAKSAAYHSFDEARGAAVVDEARI